MITSANSWEMTLLANAGNLDMCLNNAHHGMDERKGHLVSNNRWFVESSFTGYHIHTSFLLMMAICKRTPYCLFPS